MDNEEYKPERNEKGQILPGFSGNPKGRPKGQSIKEMVREYLNEHPDDMKAFVEHFVKENRSLTWQMLEGRPQQDVTTGGEKLPTPIYGGLSVPEHDSDTQDIPTEETH